jgi:general secretion pathway protein N
VLHLPAAVALGWLGLGDRLAVEGVRGTVWSGGAAAASIDDLHLGQLRWRFRPLALAIGRLDYRLEVSGPTLNFQGTVGPTAGGGLRISSAAGFVRLAALRALIPTMTTIGIDGTVNLAIERLVLAPLETPSTVNPTGLWPRTATGTVRAVDIVVPLIAEQPLGDFELDVSADPDGDDLLVDYRDVGGSLELAGTARLHPDGSFDRECNARARPGAPPKLVQAAPFICASSMF